MVASISKALPGSFSVSFRKHPFYDFNYSFQLPSILGPRTGAWLSILLGPFLLGFLASRALGIVYVGEQGFLLRTENGRHMEFEWVKNKRLAIVCFFTGSDIRSLWLMKEFEKLTNLSTLGGRMLATYPEFDNEDYDREQRMRASVADRFADLIYNSKVDQMSYLESDTLPTSYFYPDEGFRFLPEKFFAENLWRVVHAPSNPSLKGTEYVREAVSRLKDEGYSFEYVELIDVPHDEVLLELARAQIVLNEFFAFVPGVFGIEALANTCALITSADATVETDLPADSNSAWLPTKHNQIVDHLRLLLDNRAFASAQAIRGYEWALEWASQSKSGARLQRQLTELADGSGAGLGDTLT